MVPIKKVPARVYDSRQLKLRFTPYAWAKLNFMRDCVSTEIGGMGISNEDDYMLIEDILIPPQEVSPVQTKMKPGALSEIVADLADPEGDFRLKVDQFMRVWIHTHPGFDPKPSTKDLETFYSRDNFGSATWGVMYILSSSGDDHCDYRFRDHGGLDRVVSIESETVVDFQSPAIDDATTNLWASEIEENVEEVYTYAHTTYSGIYSTGIPSERSKMPKKTSSTFDDDRRLPALTDEPYWWEEDFYQYNNYGLGAFDDDDIISPSTPLQPLRPLDETDFYLRRSSIFYLMSEDDFLEFAQSSQISLTSKDASKDILEGLDKCGFPVAKVTDNDILLFRFESQITKGKNKGKTKVNMLTSDELILMDRVNVKDSKARKELEAVENKFYEFAALRDPNNSEVILDGFEVPIRAIHHWVCHDGYVMYLSSDEIDTLEEVAEGKIDRDAAFEALFFDLDREDGSPRPIGFYLGDDDEDEILGPVGDDAIYIPEILPEDKDKIVDVWIDIGRSLRISKDLGENVEEIEERLQNLRDKAVAGDKDVAFDYVLRQVEKHGFNVDAISADDLLNNAL